MLWPIFMSPGSGPLIILLFDKYSENVQVKPRLVASVLFLITVFSGLWISAQAPVHIVIAHTNDIHGQLLPKDGVGGIAEIATLIKGQHPDLILDAGDMFTGTFLSDEFK